MRPSLVIFGPLAAILIGHLPGVISEASAESCEAHLAKHGVTKQVDIEEHRAGIQPGKSPCAADRSADDKPRERDDHQDADMRRDHAGFHCYHLRCG